MCLIIDTNVAPLALCDPAHPEFEPVHRSLFGAGRPEQNLVYGGALASEYDKSGRISHAVEELRRAGRAWREDDADVDRETEVVRSGCQSNDPHIIGLARVSGVRLLCTRDHSLMADFKDTGLVPKPQGKVYTQKGNQHLLAEECRCKRCR